MGAVESLETLWQTFCRMETDGNFNQLILEALRHRHDLAFKFVATEVMTRIARIIHSHGHLITPENIRRLAALPTGLLQQRSGLENVLPGCRTTLPQPEIGCLSFAVVDSAGHVRDLMVVSGRYKEMPEDRRAQLDRVGAATVSALGCRLGLPVIWNPQRYSFWVRDPFDREDSRVSGDSMDLPLALALYSHLTKTPVPADVSASAAVQRGGTLQPVSAISTKIEALKRERHYLDRILVAEGQKEIPPTLICRTREVTDILSALELGFPAPPAAGVIDEVLDIASAEAAIQAQYDAQLSDTCLMNADALIEYLKCPGRSEPDDQRIPALFIALWRRGSCLSHRGDINGAMASLAKAIETYDRYKDLIPEESCVQCRNSYAVLLKDVFRYKHAEALHRENGKDLERIGTLGHIRAKNLSSLSQLYLAWQKFEQAAEEQKNALAMIHERKRERNYGYLAQIFTRWGRFAKAESALAEQERLLKRYHQEPGSFRCLIQAEFLYRRGLSGDGSNRANDFAALHTLAEKVVAGGITIGRPADYPKALVLKFDGLACLAEGDGKTGLDRLEPCITYLDSTREPMFPLIGAGVHAERALYLIETAQPEKAKPDAARVEEALSRNWFVHYFGTQVQILRCFESLLRADADAMRSIADAFRFVRDAIPY